jgi:hypothetical protein
MAARANLFSASEKVRNNPEVKQAMSVTYETTARKKRKSGEPSLHETRKQQHKTVRVEKRVKNLAEEKDTVEVM